MKAFMNMTKALSDETRVRILMFLSHGELCVCQIIEMLRLAPSTVSKHMSILYQAGLVKKRKSGRWNYYSLLDVRAAPEVKSALRWVQNSLAGDETVRKDKKRRKTIINKRKEECCACYNS